MRVILETLRKELKRSRGERPEEELDRTLMGLFKQVVLQLFVSLVAKKLLLDFEVLSPHEVEQRLVRADLF